MNAQKSLHSYISHLTELGILIIIFIGSLLQDTKYKTLFKRNIVIFYIFFYNFIPPQSEEKNMLHKRTQIKY